ncbi:hypothetical protein RSal33209_0810 [Renibacterium salmoninarum ATCC 33209]|uniref:Uncharacterized protein n=1 Tax=Renibacterium salmoninarum (strain ATCC 33209 / DSM 20767 / JCM 11484 / NBRC 15589 / NCIMB 2235) TaxID=288705 RepID=A9WQI4_RENSM|nr:hypothetical protein [Renibacterium salmoninarum]ABY22554.1 hypothetical protein RSal33209_0810 [Renibacterium salmoninarum ATCC 33209]
MSEFPGPAVPAEQGSLLESEPASWPESVTATGDAGVDRVLGLLDTLPETATADHPQQFEQLHDGLLTELESGPEEAESHS